VERILPTYEGFVKLENKTLKLLYNRLSQLRTLAHASGLVQQCWGCTHLGMFRFGIYWDVDYRDKECRLFLGADVWKQKDSDDIANTSYCICIVEGTDKPNKVLRKFHFDYVTVFTDRKEPHPRFHLQYCGGLPSFMENLGITKELMDLLLPNVDGPRIFFRPMTLALLMNMAFHEFPCQDTDEIKRRGEWQNLVRENERKILVPFYERCAQLAGKDRIVFFDEAYVQ
jgi:hypothetical protein